MPTPRYTVFISSTFVDLKEARQNVLQAVLELDCIPMGMEMFAASSDAQFKYITREIDASDYYVLIPGWRYGSIHADGVSYTEREFDYALSKQLPVLVFPHGDRSAVPPEHLDQDQGKEQAQVRFRERAMQGRTTRYWKSGDELAAQVARSLGHEIRDKPRVGWIRADSGPDRDTLLQLTQLQTENIALRTERDQLRAEYPRADVPDIAGLDEPFVFIYGWHPPKSPNREARKTLTWLQIFKIIAPVLIGHRHESEVSSRLGATVYKGRRQYIDRFWVSPGYLELIGLQLEAYGLVTVSRLEAIDKSVQIFWKLTKAGESAKMKYCTVKRSG